MKICVMSTVNIKLTWTDGIKFMSPFFFHQMFCQLSFYRHILDIMLTSFDVHILFTIWHQQNVKIKSIDVVIMILTKLLRQFEVRVPTGIFIRRVIGDIKVHWDKGWVRWNDLFDQGVNRKERVIKDRGTNNDERVILV